MVDISKCINTYFQTNTYIVTNLNNLQRRTHNFIIDILNIYIPLFT